MKKRPSFIVNRRELAPREEFHSNTTAERFGFPSDFARATGLSRLKLMHLTLPPGRRTNAPGAYRDEEEFLLVLEGTADLWLDGHLHTLREGDAVWFNDRTGIAHTLINNSDATVRLFAFGEATRMASQFHVALERDSVTASALNAFGKLWPDPPKRRLGPHDAMPDRERGTPSPKGARKTAKPPFVANWGDILGVDAVMTYPHSKEEHGIDALFNKLSRFSRIGIHVEVLPPGRRTSWPHAERDEEEFVYVMAGKVDCWLDGHIHPLGEGDFVGWESRTGITHVVINNSDEDAVLLIGGEASRQRNQFWYPFHPHRNKEIGPEYWHDRPEPKFGPHDGLPDALRASLPPASRRNALAANTAAWKLGWRKKK